MVHYSGQVSDTIGMTTVGILAGKVDRLFEGWDRPDSPGCALVVMKGGDIVYKRGYGMANLEYDIPITPRSIFQAASLSKQFTAMASVMLVKERQLSLDDDVRQYVPELPDFGETITVRHLLQHTSGLREQWHLLALAGWRPDDVVSTEDILELVWRQQELNFRPGTEWIYCNTGYTLLAVIIERVGGKSLRDYCSERIFRPLGMSNTHFHDDNTMIVKNRAYSYTPRDEGGFRHAVTSFTTNGVGPSSLFTTVEDLALWEENYYTATVGGTQVVEQLQTPGTLGDGEQIGYGLGLGIGCYRGLNIVEHSGGDAGYCSHLMRVPGQHFSVAILGNESTMHPSELARQVTDIYLDDIFTEEREAARPIELSTERLSSRAGLYSSAATASTRRLEMRDEKLFWVLGTGFELLPVSEDIFRISGLPDTKVRFVPSAGKGTRQLHWIEGNQKTVLYEAVANATPTMEELTVYAGDYYSPELDVRYTVVLQGDQLAIRRRKVGVVKLVPTFADGFATDDPSVVFSVVFSRDDEKQVTSFRLSTGVVRNLLFVRER